MIRLLIPLVVLVCALVGPARAQGIDARGILQLQQPATGQAQTQERRVALVIGNSSYRHAGRLRNPQADAEAMARFLGTTARFELIGGGAVIDADRGQMVEAIRAFGRQLQAGGVGLFYYAGHGIEWRGANYLIPVDANPVRDSDIEFDLVSANAVLTQMEQAGSRLNMLILDACRNNPLIARGVRAAGSGLQAMRAAAGTIISFAAEPGALALDGEGANSPYNLGLMAAMNRPGVNVLDVFNQVGLEVTRLTNNRQIPWVNSSPIEGQFYFVGGAPANVGGGQVRSGGQSDGVAEIALWTAIRNSNDPNEFEGFLQMFPNGAFAEAARQGLARVRGQTPATNPQPRPDLPPTILAQVPQQVAVPSPPASRPPSPPVAQTVSPPPVTPPVVQTVSPPPVVQTVSPPPVVQTVSPPPVAQPVAPPVQTASVPTPVVTAVARSVVLTRAAVLRAAPAEAAQRVFSVGPDSIVSVTGATTVSGESWLRVRWQQREAWMREAGLRDMDRDEAATWLRIRTARDAAALDSFAQRYPDGYFAERARRRAEELRAEAAQPRPTPVPQPQTPQPPPQQMASAPPGAICCTIRRGQWLLAQHRQRSWREQPHRIVHQRFERDAPGFVAIGRHGGLPEQESQPPGLLLRLGHGAADRVRSRHLLEQHFVRERHAAHQRRRRMQSCRRPAPVRLACFRAAIEA
jgi:uncharacterized caspase-like protein